jgi:hypothetical protein
MLLEELQRRSFINRPINSARSICGRRSVMTQDEMRFDRQFAAALEDLGKLRCARARMANEPGKS